VENIVENNHWQKIMLDVLVDMIGDNKLDILEYGNLRTSIYRPIDELRMWHDTNKRIGRHK
jgi:hypothetical protein